MINFDDFLKEEGQASVTTNVTGAVAKVDVPLMSRGRQAIIRRKKSKDVSLKEEFNLSEGFSDKFRPSSRKQEMKHPVSASEWRKAHQFHSSKTDAGDTSSEERAILAARRANDARATGDKDGHKKHTEQAMQHLQRHLETIQHAQMARISGKIHHHLLGDEAEASGNHDLKDQHRKKAKEFDY